MSGSVVAVRLRERLTIVLLANEGLNNGEIAEELSISAHMAGDGGSVLPSVDYPV